MNIEDVKHCLQFSIFSDRTVEAHKCDVCHFTKFEDIWSDEAVRLIRTLFFQSFKIGNGCLNTFCNLQSAAGEIKNFVEFVSVIWKSEKDIQQEGLMSFFS